MKRPNGNRARLGALVLSVAIGAAALLALPAIGIGHDHPRGGDPAGTVESFNTETGQLTIALTDGGTISALVTPRTHVRCGDEGRRRHGHGLGNHSGDDPATTSSRGPGSGPPEGSDNEPPRGRGPSGDDGTPGDDPAGEDNHGRGEDQPGHDENEPGEDVPGHGDHGQRCLDQLVTGAVVQGAQVVLIDGKAFYKDVGLVPPAPPAAS